MTLFLHPGDVNRTDRSLKSIEVNRSDRSNQSKLIEVIVKAIKVNQSLKECKSSIGFDRFRLSDQLTFKAQIPKSTAFLWPALSPV